VRKETERQRKIDGERDRGERGEESGKEIMNKSRTKEPERERVKVKRERDTSNKFPNLKLENFDYNSRLQGLHLS
jgi:hypothetical protein